MGVGLTKPERTRAPSHSPGRKFYDRKRDEGHTSKSAIRALKRRISDVAYRHLVADKRRAFTQ